MCWNQFYCHCFWPRVHTSIFLKLFSSFGKAVTFLQKLSSTHWFPTRDIPRLPSRPVPSLPLRRWYDPKARRFVCLGKENILWGQVKQDVLECGPSLLLALCNNALRGANAHTQTHMSACTLVCTHSSEMPYLTTTYLVLGNAFLTGYPVVFTLKEEFVIRTACSEQDCLNKTLCWENVKR